MDRAWMYDLARIDPMYIENIRRFLEEAMRHANREKKSDIFCHCVDCDNKIVWSDSKVVKSHLIKRGDEDINTSATIIPFIEILGSITRSRAQQLNHQVNSFLCSFVYNIES
jgi:hypothetical protein